MRLRNEATERISERQLISVHILANMYICGVTLCMLLYSGGACAIGVDVCVSKQKFLPLNT